MTDIADDYPEATLTLKSQSTVGIRDILYFSPGLFDSIPIKVRDNATVTLNTHLNGKVKDLAVSNLRSRIVGYKIVNDRKHKRSSRQEAMIHASIDEFFTTGKDLKAILDDSIVSKFGLPKHLSLKGKYDGTISTPSVKAELTSDLW